MKLVKSALVLAVASAALLLVSIKPSTATQKYAKETGKKCLDCHTKVPKKGATDPQLNELGKKFAENGHKLPKE
jgi:cytochrome c2